MLARDGQLERKRPTREEGSAEDALPDARKDKTENGEGVTPKSWVSFRDFLTSSARSHGRRRFVVGGRSSA